MAVACLAVVAILVGLFLHAWMSAEVPPSNTTHCHDKQQQSLTRIAYETNVVSDINT